MARGTPTESRLAVCGNRAEFALASHHQRSRVGSQSRSRHDLALDQGGKAEGCDEGAACFDTDACSETLSPASEAGDLPRLAHLKGVMKDYGKTYQDRSRT